MKEAALHASVRKIFQRNGISGLSLVTMPHVPPAHQRFEFNIYIYICVFNRVGRGMDHGNVHDTWCSHASTHSLY